jgi:glycine dehydrogenase subunit 1
LSAYSPQLGEALLVCATETKTDADIDAYIAAMADVLDTQSLRSA